MSSDNSNIDTQSDFTSSGGDRVSSTPKPTLEPADVVSLPKGQAFALLEGGRLHKIRMPLPKAEDADELPADLTEITERMKERYQTGHRWWADAAPPPIAIDGTPQARPAPLPNTDFEDESDSRRAPAAQTSSWAGHNMTHPAHEDNFDVDGGD